MSYILDALQRADAERARGGVPTLHARPIAGPPTPHGLNTRQRAGLAIAVALAVGAAALTWWLWQPSPPQPAVVVALAPAAQPMQAQVPAAVPAYAASTAVFPLPSPATVPSRAVAAVIVTPPKAKAVAVVPAPTLAPLLSELPEATRRQIPTMAISGAVYSDNPSQRLLLVNGQVLNQGSQVAPDLTVVEIHANNSEFNFRGTRFRVGH